MGATTVTISCGCGAYNATAAAYRQMSEQQRHEFLRRVRECRTCQIDRERK